MIHLLGALAIGSVVLLAAVCLLALPVIVAAVVLASFVLWLWMLVDAIRNNELTGWARVGWAVLIWFTHWIGALIYFCVARKGRIQRASVPVLSA